MSAFSEILDAASSVNDKISRVTGVVAKVTHTRDQIEGSIGMALKTKDLIVGGKKLHDDLQAAADRGEPPSTLGMLVEMGSFLGVIPK